jgi:hypothetical protein
MKTAIQEVFSDLEKLHPNLFNIYTTEGKEFVNHFHKYLKIEKQQIVDAWFGGYLNGEIKNELASEDYYNETYKKTDK